MNAVSGPVHLLRRSSVDGHPLMTGRDARTSGGPGAQVTIALRRSLALLQVSAFAQDADAAAARLSDIVGLSLPGPNRLSGDAALSLRATGPGIWQVVGQGYEGDEGDEGDEGGRVPAASALRSHLDGVATVVDLGHARTAFRLSGAGASRTLARHCAIDLDPLVFPDGAATSTRFNQLALSLARIDGRDVARIGGDSTPAFELMVFRGYAVFVLESLFESARELGVSIEM